MPNTSSRARSAQQDKNPAARPPVSSVPLLRSKSRRRARKRFRLNRRFTGWEWCGFVASLCVSVFLVRSIALTADDHAKIQEQLHENQLQWSALERQRQEEAQRLSFLKSDEGRGQLLAERGYLKPGDRILLFPSVEEAETKTEGEPKVESQSESQTKTDEPKE